MTQEKSEKARQMELRLIKWMRNDLEAGFGAAYETYWRLLYRIADSVVGDDPCIAHLAEDIAQDGAIKALTELRKRPEILEDPEFKFRNWLAKIVQNKALYCLSKAKDHVILNSSLVGEELLEESIIEEGYINHRDPAIIFEVWEQRLEARHIVREQLATLPPEQRTAIEQKYLMPNANGKKKTSEQVAKELGLPTGTVKSQLKRAKDRMRKQLEARDHQIIISTRKKETG